MRSFLLEGYGTFLSVQNKVVNLSLNEQDEIVFDSTKGTRLIAPTPMDGENFVNIAVNTAFR